MGESGEDSDTEENNIRTANTPAYGGRLRSKLQEKFYKMSSALCEVVDDYGLVSFHPMNIEDIEVGTLHGVWVSIIYVLMGYFLNYLN